MKNKEISVLCRESEKKLLSDFISESKPSFLASYGRRRIGKTFLIRESCQSAGYYLEITGIRGAALSVQLHQFDLKLAELFSELLPTETSGLSRSNTWLEAFQTLTDCIKKIQVQNKFLKKTRFILFLDELPWLAGAKSGVMEAIEYYWNNQWSTWNYFKLIVCGSAASWMLEKIIEGKGGVHNRITHRMPLAPFTWHETAEFLKTRGFKWTAHQIMTAYLILGGVPFYLDQLKPSVSLNQNIHQICFTEGGVLQDEFDRLFGALFDDPKDYEQIVRLLAKHRYGLSREELIQNSTLSSGGHLDSRLKALEASGFIGRYVPYGKNKRQVFFRLLDEFLLFHLKWIEPARTGHAKQKNYWQLQTKTPSYLAWSGYAFEGACIQNIDVIAEAIGLANIGYLAHSWRNLKIIKKTEISGVQSGAQIDLLFDRDDGVISLCEIKFNLKPLVINKSLAQEFKRKIECFESAVQPSKSINFALITLAGAKENIWSEGLVDQMVQLDACLYKTP